MGIEERTVFPQESEEVLHHYAYSCYQQGHFDKAINTFRLLVMFCPHNGDYWYGLGSSLMLQGMLQEAAQAFQIAAVHCADDPRPLAYRAECVARLGDIALAEKLIDEAQKRANVPQFKAFHEQIDLIKERVINEVANG